MREETRSLAYTVHLTLTEFKVMLISAFLLCRYLFKSLLLFLSANSSSDGFLSGLRLGSSFFMVLGLLLRSCIGKIKSRASPHYFKNLASEMHTGITNQKPFNSNKIQFTNIFLPCSICLNWLISSLPLLQLYTKSSILSVLLTEIYIKLGAKAFSLFGS